MANGRGNGALRKIGAVQEGVLPGGIVAVRSGGGHPQNPERGEGEGGGGGGGGGPLCVGWSLLPRAPPRANEGRGGPTQKN